MLKLFDFIKDSEHIIWDWNGTLLSDVEHAVTTVNQTLLAPRNLPLQTIETYKQVFCFPISKYYEKLGVNMANESFEQLCEDFVDAFMANVHSCGLVPGARDLLQKVKASGKTQSVLSATDQPNLHRQMELFDLKHCFDFIFGIENKQAAGKIHRGHDLMAESKIAKNKTVLIGDTDHDLEVGQALGIPVLLLAHGHQCSQRLRKLHDNVIDIDELT